MTQYPLVLLLLIAMFLCSRKSFSWIIAAALVMASGSRLLRIADFSSTFVELHIVQSVAGILMVAGQLLRKTDSVSPVLFFRARMRGTENFSQAELMKLLHFSALAKRTVMNVSMTLCMLAAIGILAIQFIESGGSSASSQVSRILSFPLILFPIFLPLMVGIIISQFLLRVQDSIWFKTIPQAKMRREPVELPASVWFFPALAILLVWSQPIFAYLATF